jgi:hypothetical protein
MVASSNVDFQTATLGQQVDALFRGRTQLRSTQATNSLKACIRTVAASKTLKMVASALYRGAPATVVIVDDEAGFQAIIAGQHCSATDGDILATAVVSPGISTP